MTIKMIIKYFPLLVLLSLLAACTPSPENVTEKDVFPNIYPDYIGVTVPENIAPLNFLLGINRIR